MSAGKYDLIISLHDNEYNSLDFYKTLYFTGKPGVQFRVTLTAFAMDSTGSDTGTVTSYVVTCN